MHLPHEINVCLQLRQMPFADVGKRRKYVEIVCIRRGRSKVKKVEEGRGVRRRTTEATSTTMGSQVELSNRYCFPLPPFNTSHTHSLTLLLLLLLLLVIPLCPSTARPPIAPPFPRFCLLFARILFNNLIASHSLLVLVALRCVPKQKKKKFSKFVSLRLRCRRCLRWRLRQQHRAITM